MMKTFRGDDPESLPELLLGSLSTYIVSCSCRPPIETYWGCTCRETGLNFFGYSYTESSAMTAVTARDYLAMVANAAEEDVRIEYVTAVIKLWNAFSTFIASPFIHLCVYVCVCFYVQVQVA